jgi:oxalate---CoA ligase
LTAQQAEALGGLLAAARGDSPALVLPDDRRTLSYGELVEAGAGLAGKLRSIGVERGDRVAFVLPNGPEVVLMLFAVSALGAGAAPLNPAYTRDEYAFYLDDLGPRLLVLPAGENAAARAAAPAGLRIAELAGDGRGGMSLSLDRREVGSMTPFEPASADDVALLLHTSGTTSRPKQVPLLQRNLAAAARSIAAHYQLGAADVSYCAMPLFHVHGIVASALAALGAGGSVVIPRRFGARTFWEQAREHGVTWLSAGPTLHQMILDRADPEGTRESLRFVRSCSSALAPALMTRAEETYGVPMLEAYGMTEASHQIASNPLPPGRRLPGSVGIPTGCDVRIADARGGTVGDGAAGEVVIRGPGVTSGYLANPEANAESFFDGWFRTGDRGVLEEGYIRLEGRLKEMILRGGENVSPYEVEEVLLAHPEVADAVCFGIEDAKYGEEVGAAVTLTGTADERELIGHCRERLAAFKTPTKIYIVDEIPRTPTGKVQRRRVGALLAWETA